MHRSRKARLLRQSNADFLSPKAPGAPATPAEPWEQTDLPEEKLPPKAEKLKTHALQQPQEVPDIGQLAIEEPPSPDRIEIPVKANNLKILNKMYSREENHKAITWDQFVAAMADAGFSSRQMTGSVVVFKPVEGNKFGWTGRINIHRPHPEDKLYKIPYRIIGKRLRMEFQGWGEGAFVERPKDE